MDTPAHRWIIFALYVLCPALTSSQVLQGVVLDKATDQPVPLAHVFLEGTTHGTIAEIDGSFKLDISGWGAYPLISTALGYRSQPIPKDSIRQGRFVVYLSSTAYDLATVEVVADESNRRRYLRIFKDQFLGTSRYGKKCIIENEDAIYFSFSEQTHTLEAFCQGPLIIRNRMLDYRITYWLESFRYSANNIFYQGYQHFQPLSNSPKERVIDDRHSAFEGSIYHFIQCLWHDNWTPSGFVLLPGDDVHSEANQPYMELVEVLDFGHYKMVYINRPLKVVYTPTEEVSYIEQTLPYTLIESNGYFPLGSIRWTGDMAKKRVGDQLPFSPH